MLKRRRIQFPDDSSELDLSSQHVDDDQEEVELVDATDPSKLRNCCSMTPELDQRTLKSSFKLSKNIISKYLSLITVKSQTQAASLPITRHVLTSKSSISTIQDSMMKQSSRLLRITLGPR